MPQLAQRLGLDLANTLASDREVLADFLQGVLAPVRETEAQAQHLLLARRQGIEHLVRLLAQRQPDDRFHRGHHLLVLDEIAEVAVLLLADGRLERDGVLRDLGVVGDVVDGDVDLGRDLFRGGLAPELLHELPRGADELVDRLDHVDRDPDRAGLVGDGPGNRLADPPRRVRRELVAPTIFELVDGLHEPDVAFLDEIQELQAAIRVLLRDRDHEPQVRLHHLLLGLGGLLLTVLDDGHDLLDVVRLGVGPGLRRLDLLLGHPDLLLLGALELLGGAQVQIAVDPVGAVEAGVAEGHVDEVLDLLRRRTPAIGPQRDDPLGALDVVHEVAQALDQPTPREVVILPVDDLVADLELAQLLEDLGLARPGLAFDALPLRLLDPRLGLLAAGFGRRLRLELAHVLDEAVPLAEEPIDRAEGVDHLARQLRLLLLRELLLVDVDDLLHGHVLPAKLVPQLAEALDGEVRAEDGLGDLALALLDALGQRDLALAGEERDAPHLAQVEPYGILRAAHGSGGEVYGVAPALVVFVRGCRTLHHLGGQARGFGGIHELDVEGAEHHHDVVELIERHDVRRESVVHLVVGEEALLFTHRDQPVELFQLRFFTHASELLVDLRGPCGRTASRDARARTPLDSRVAARASRRGSARRLPPRPGPRRCRGRARASGASAGAARAVAETPRCRHSRLRATSPRRAGRRARRGPRRRRGRS